MEKENLVSYDIRAGAYKVYKKLGPGLLESVYERALVLELQKMGHKVMTQVGIPVVYEAIEMEIGFRLDILVDDLVIIEVKSVDALAPVHFKQVMTYLKLSGKRLGILINFNTDFLKDSIKRIVL